MQFYLMNKTKNWRLSQRPNNIFNKKIITIILKEEKKSNKIKITKHQFKNNPELSSRLIFAYALVLCFIFLCREGLFGEPFETAKRRYRYHCNRKTRKSEICLKHN